MQNIRISQIGKFHEGYGQALFVWYDITERDQPLGTQLEVIELVLQYMTRCVRTARGSAEAIIKIIRRVIIAKDFYDGGLSH